MGCDNDEMALNPLSHRQTRATALQSPFVHIYAFGYDFSYCKMWSKPRQHSKDTYIDEALYLGF